MTPSKFPMKILILMTAAGIVFSSAGRGASAQRERRPSGLDASLYKALEWRLIGPFRGGRATAVAGIPSRPSTYYFGATGGGVWKTEDGGLNWKCVSDGFFRTGSVGAIAVSESDPNVVYVGMGEAPIRGNVSHGDGVYKSTDAGKTWKPSGLVDTSQISRVRIHPRNPDLAYVAALGHVYGPNEERGVYRTSDGGKTWERVLFRNTRTGAIDLALDPTNPRMMFASLWEAGRTPYSLTSGGPGSGLFKSSDGGSSWTEISRNTGLPQGVLGKIGVTVSPAAPNRVWAIVEAEDGGVFRSDDGGQVWRRVNEDRRLRQRAWYYSRIYADPKDAETVYVLNTAFYRSTDGGKTYTPIAVPHGDNHDLWIDPENPQRMINSNDGGANVTMNGGLSWTGQDNQPTAQFYHVAVDNRFPYWVYGAQQDNSTVRIASRTDSFGIGEADWHDVGGGESGFVVPRPDNPDVVYAGNYSGYITRWDTRTRRQRVITAWPENPMGSGADVLKYRFQWTAPILASRHDPDVLYHAAQVLFKTTNEGQSWEVISPDLTTNDKTRQQSSGGPITQDNTGVEYYCTIFALAESFEDPNILWVGTDDGLVHLTRDGGKTWENITPRELP
ncbi:MAG: glycosyl hydrolase, repeat-containing protein, partial [Candidatus Aminicenantes bacterium]|nr:glycosyl hydrolase, repeat-containing protein [Candidatus Aminicenantes bacterium]